MLYLSEPLLSGANEPGGPCYCVDIELEKSKQNEHTDFPLLEMRKESQEGDGKRFPTSLVSLF